VNITTHRLPRELVESTAFLLKRLGFLAKERALDAYDEAGFSPYSHAVLAVLDESSRETQGAIADALGYDRGQLVGILDELEDRGLVERRRDPEDRRRHIVRLTPDGKQALKTVRKLSQRLEEDLLGTLSAREREALHALLAKLASEHLPTY